MVTETTTATVVSSLTASIGRTGHRITPATIPAEAATTAGTTSAPDTYASSSSSRRRTSTSSVARESTNLLSTAAWSPAAPSVSVMELAR